MGNAALHSPPPASSRRYVMIIVSNDKFGISLKVLESQQPEQQQQTDRGDVEEGNNNNINNNNNDNRILPFSFEGGPIDADEFFEKLADLREILTKWKGGLYSLILVIYTITLLIASMIAHLTPQFWTSPFFNRAWYSFAVVGFLLVMVLSLMIAVRLEFNCLITNVEDLYRPWKARGVRVSMVRVATLGKYQELMPRNNNISNTNGCTCNYFCVVMDMMDGDEEAAQLDDGSVATVDTIEEDDVE